MLSLAINGYFHHAVKVNKRMTTAKSSSSLAALVKSMSVTQFNEILNNPDTRSLYQIVDVREKNELQIANYKKSDDITHLPLGSANEWASKVETGQLLNCDKPTIVACHHGGRSMQVASFLVGKAGFEEVYNLEGGINQYSVKCDPSIPQY